MISDYGEEFIPKRSTKQSAGYDLVIPQDLDMMPNVWYTVDTGIHLEKGDIKDHQCLLVLPRSVLGFKYKMKLANTIGLIDSDYRDSIKACISVEEPLFLEKGTRFLQFIVSDFGLVANEVPPTEVRKSGLGSTGLKG